MAHLACPCGNGIWNGGDSNETEFYFLSDEAIKGAWEDRAFFELEDGVATEMWICDICDRMMVFDDPSGAVSRYMRRVDSELVPSDLTDMRHTDGICHSNLLLNEIDEHLAGEDKWREASEYNFFGDDEDGGKLLTPKVMQEEIFSCKNGRFLHWWYARMYEDWLVFWSPFDPKRAKFPVKAWKQYDRVWLSE